MDVGLSIAASGMLAEQVREDQLANDLSNASTPGYKPDDVEQSSFGSMLLPGGADGSVAGTIDTGVQITREVTNMTQGGVENTGEPLDFAITGQGFFAVRTTSGVRYTRDGQFTASAAGDLIDASGNEVLSQSGSPIKLATDGTVASNLLGVFDVPNAIKQGANLFTGSSTGRASGTVSSGALEGSGVDAARTIVDMIAALNNYQSGENAIQTIQQIDQRSANSVGSLSGN